MHFWNIQAVARQLDDGTLSEWEKGRYLIACFVMPVVTGYTVSFLASQPPIRGTSFTLSLLALLLEAFALIVGFIHLFNRHARRHATGFVERMVCLSVPASVRTFVLGWLGWAAFVLLLGSLGGDWVYAGVLAFIGDLGPIVPAIYFNLLFFFFMRKGA